jgi:adenosine deaminase
MKIIYMIDLFCVSTENQFHMNNNTNLDPNFPLCDLHRHLDGSIRIQTILELAEQHGVVLPANTPDALKPYVQVFDSVSGLVGFIAKFRYLTEVLVDTQACYRIARENVEDALAEGIDYIELRFSPWFMAEAHKLDPADVVAAVIDGVRDGSVETGVKTKLIGILSRTYGPEVCMSELQALMQHRDGLVALDLAGDEYNYPAALFREHFKLARDAGLRSTVHAGEGDGAASVWSAIRDLGAERIGHGIRSVEDPRLMDHLAENDIGLEVCLTSNVHTSTVESYAAHPAKRIMEHGVKMNLNTDDPGISDIDLPFEYEVAALKSGLNQVMTRAAQVNALEMAFIDQDEKAELIARRL